MAILSNGSPIGNTQVLFKILPQPAQRGPHAPPQGLKVRMTGYGLLYSALVPFRKAPSPLFPAPLPLVSRSGGREASGAQAGPARAGRAAPAALTTLVRISCRRGEALASTTRLLTSFPSTGFNTMAPPACTQPLLRAGRGGEAAAALYVAAGPGAEPAGAGTERPGPCLWRLERPCAGRAALQPPCSALRGRAAAVSVMSCAPAEAVLKDRFSQIGKDLWDRVQLTTEHHQQTMALLQLFRKYLKG